MQHPAKEVNNIYTLNFTSQNNCAKQYYNLQVSSNWKECSDE